MKRTVLILCALLHIVVALTAVEEALFSVTNNEEPPDTIFAVYPSGIKVLGEDGELVMIANRDSVRLYIDETVEERSSRGGFAIGGVASLGGQEYFLVSPESTRVFFNELEDRSSRGGFAIGGVASLRDVTTDYLSINPDSTRINVKDSDEGFSVGNIQAGGTSKFMDLKRLNYFIGHQSGMNNTNGYKNLFFGYKSGYSNTYGYNNTFIGERSGYYNTGGNNNLYIGYESGYKSGDDGVWHPSHNVYIGDYSGYEAVADMGNVYIGYNSGSNISTGGFNTIIGYGAGAGGDLNTDPTTSYSNSFFGASAGTSTRGGYANSFFGLSAGWNNITGTKNAYFGVFAGGELEAGEDNTFLGYRSGHYRETGSYNTFLGFNSGGGVDHNNPTSGDYNLFLGYETGKATIGSGNVFIGKQVAKTLASASNTLMIDNSDTTSPLIYGDFSANELVINGNSAHNTNNRTLFVNGEAGGNDAWYNDSDRNLKKNIETIPNALSKVLKLRGVNFEWKEKDASKRGKRIGFIAQEAEEVIPEVVDNTDGHYAMQYAPINALLVEAIKKQQKIIDEMNFRIEKLEEQINDLIK